MTPEAAELARVIETKHVQAIAAVLMARRQERTGEPCWTNGYGGNEGNGSGCNGEPSLCRCCDEAEDDAKALIAAGYRKAADVREEMAKVAEADAASCRNDATRFPDKHDTWAACAMTGESIAAAIRAAKP